MKYYYHKYNLVTDKKLNAKEVRPPLMTSEQKDMPTTGGQSRGVDQRQHTGLLFRIVFDDLLFDDLAADCCKLNYKDVAHPSEGFVGYSSYPLHPALGDPSVQEILFACQSFLRQDTEHGQSNVSLIANARVQAQGLWLAEQDFVPSHFTSLSACMNAEELKTIKALGFQRIKVKVGVDKNSFTDLIHWYIGLPQFKDFQWIFDFNMTGDANEIMHVYDWLQVSGKISGSHLDVRFDGKKLPEIYLEDPVPPHPQVWKNLTSHGCQLLADQMNMEQLKTLDGALAAIVVKPAKMYLPDLVQAFPHQKFLVTSNMGESIDLLNAAYWASWLRKNHKENFWGAGYRTEAFFRASPYLEAVRGVPLAPQLHWDKAMAEKQKFFLESLDWHEV